MAQGVRPRPLTASVAAIPIALCALHACGGRESAAPRPVDTAAVPAEGLVAAVLDECHAPIRGRMQRVRALVTGPDGGERLLEAALPDRARLQAGTDRWLLADGAVRRYEGAPASEADADLVRRVVRLVDAAAFGPLYRATGCRRTGPAEFVLEQPNGGATRLALRPGTLLPASLGDGGDEVRFVDYVHPTGTWVVRVAELDGLGRCRVVFEDGGMDFPDDWFRPPSERAAPSEPRHRIAAPGVAIEPRSPVPVAIDVGALRLVVLPDPGDWPARVAAYRPVHDELVRQDQQIAGFPLLWRDGDGAWLAAPFRQRPGKAPLRVPADWRVTEVAAGRCLVVYPPDGDLDQRIAAGTTELGRALAARGLTARGPIRAQPWLHLEEGEPDAARLAAPTVRMLVAIE